MRITTDILVSIPDSLSIANIQNEKITNTCSTVTQSDGLGIAICVTILIAIAIIALTIVYCVSKTSRSKLKELKSRNSHELAIIEKESLFKERKDQYDSAWRTIEHAWKEREKTVTCDSDEKHRETETDPNVIKAFDYIRYFWDTERLAKEENNSIKD